MLVRGLLISLGLTPPASPGERRSAHKNDQTVGEWRKHSGCYSLRHDWVDALERTQRFQQRSNAAGKSVAQIAGDRKTVPGADG